MKELVITVCSMKCLNYFLKCSNEIFDVLQAIRDF